MEPPSNEPDRTAIERLAKERFGGQGMEILDTVMVYASRPARLDFIVKRLDLHCGASVANRLDALKEYAVSQGWERFARRLRYEQWKALQNDPDADTVAREIFNSLVRLDGDKGQGRVGTPPRG